MKLSDLEIGDDIKLRASNSEEHEVYQIVVDGTLFTADKIELSDLPDMFNEDMSDLLDDSEHDIILVSRDGAEIWKATP